MPAKNNPWKDRHMAGEMNYTGGGYTRSHAARLVDHEYAGAPDAFPCEQCDGGTVHYRATVGAMQCTSCRALYHCNGEAYPARK